MKIIKYVGKALYHISGLAWIVSEVESFILNYRLRVRMVPVSYKLFVFVLGAVVGGSAVFVSQNYQIALESQNMVFENTRTITVAHAKENEPTIEEKIADMFPENPEVMIALAKAESGLDPMATNRNTNGSRDIGLFQINSIHGHDDLEMFDVDKNLKAARAIYDKSGITAWAAWNNGSYKKFIK